MKLKKVIKLIFFLLLFITICMYAFLHFVRLREKDGYKYTYMWETIEKLNKSEMRIKDIDQIGIVQVLDILFYDKSMWNKLPLTDNFVQKFKNPQGIISKYYDYESIGAGMSYDYDKDNVIFVDCTERDNLVSLITGKNITTYYTFEYLVDDNNQLDDLILLKEVDIDSMTAETYDVREY